MKDLVKSIAILLIVSAFAFSCKPIDEPDPTPSLDNTTVKDGVVTVKPFEYYNAFRNPMKGWREFFGPGVDPKRSEYPYPFGSIIKEYMQWNMMESVESDGVDKVIAYSDHRWQGMPEKNIKVIPRPYIVWMEPYEGGYPKNTYNSNPDDLNGWHWPSDFPAEVRSDDNNTPSTGGYFDPTFLDRMKKLVKKLGEAWDNDPRVAYVEMGLIGEWGEHHDPSIRGDMWAPHTQSNHVAGRTWIPGVEKVLGDAFTEAFKNKKVMVRYAYDFQDYNFGYYWDSFAYEGEDERGFNWYKRRGDFWKDQVMGGEITWNYWEFQQDGCKSLEGVLANNKRRQTVIDQVRGLHVNHLGGVTWAKFTDQNFYTNASTIQKIMGYRFVIKELNYPERVEVGQPFEVSFSVLNTGSSPFYYDWPVEISLINTDTRDVVWKTTLTSPKISQWMPGDNWDTSKQSYTVPAELNTVKETVKIDKDIPAGQYAIAVAVLDPAGMVPSLRFAVFNYYNGGRHPMGLIGVGADCPSHGLLMSSFDDIQADQSLYYVYEK
ncbi:MAG: DUF4832 domain-containing protein [Bacteroidales bacterium]|nr:DUF4832 domain-containing protein [Bacteroidales bacterium]